MPATAYTPTVAVIVPCHNEETAIAQVVSDLRAALPDATIYVYDNASSDDTAAVASAAGALVRQEFRMGKGNVIRRAFADIDADVVVMLDGDGTYDAARASDLVDTVLAGPYDQVIATRQQIGADAYRAGHAWGNRMLTWVTATIFGRGINDMLSGYRAFSRRFVKSFPALSREFETETEMTIHALSLRLPVAEIEADYGDRAHGSQSKLRTYRDGWRVLTMILSLVRRQRPVLFHGVIAALLALLALVLGMPIVVEFLQTGLVPRFPTAILASALVVIASVVLMLGYVLEASRHSREEALRLHYLSYPAPPHILAETRTRRGAG